MRRIDLTGKKFGRLTVRCYSHTAKGAAIFSCDCECGRSNNVASGHLVSGRTKSCGCLIRDITSDRNRTHGMSTTLSYYTWSGMHRRCTNPHDKSYPHYGGRGIMVCERWQSFENFLADMSEKPAGETIDRIDNDGPYSPENCVWATRREQNRNKRNSRLLTFEGKSMCLAAWAEELGIGSNTISERLRRGWTVDAALSASVRGASCQ